MHPKRAIQCLTALGMSVAMGVLALGAVILIDTRADAWRQAEQASNNLVLALTRDIERTITLYDISIQGAINALAQPDIDQLSPETRQLALFDRAATADYLGVMLVLNPSGDVVADSSSSKPHDLNLSEREHFKVHQERADVGLFTSRPYKSRMRSGDLSVAFSRRISGPNGRFDGVERLYTYRHVPGLPLILSVAVAVDDIYAMWSHKAMGIGAVLLLLCGATVTLCLLFRREILRRMDAETGLRDAAADLAIMAATDGLTGLANRRAFDEHLVREWNRSIRTQTPIALLMIDADLFKAYNDCYGHVEGDQVLRAIAICVARNVLRSSDIGARYGGEEFAVLLPDTELSGAAALADHIRAAVSAMKKPHDGSAIGHVTVSIGVATMHARFGDAPTVLLERADTALYDAKHKGRNRVGVADWPNVPLAWNPIAREGRQIGRQTAAIIAPTAVIANLIKT